MRHSCFRSKTLWRYEVNRPYVFRMGQLYLACWWWVEQSKKIFFNDFDFEENKWFTNVRFERSYRWKLKYTQLIQRQAYRRRDSHQKKELSIEEQNRRLWKQRKQRDKHWQGHCHRGPHDKAISKAKERALVRNLMRLERYDDVRADHRREVWPWWY